MLAFGLIIFILVAALIACAIWRRKSQPISKIVSTPSNESLESFESPITSKEVFKKDYGRFTILHNTFKTNDTPTMRSDSTIDYSVEEFSATAPDDITKRISVPIFIPRIKSRRASKAATTFYPKYSVEKAGVPNPVFSHRNQRLITSVYVTNKNSALDRPPRYYSGGSKDIVDEADDRKYKKWSELTREKTDSQ